MEILSKANNILLSFFKPELFDTSNKDSYIIKSSKEFEMSCHALGKHTAKDVKEMTAKEYFSLIEFLQKEAKQIKEQSRKRR